MILFSVTLRGTYIYDDLPVILNDSRVHHPAKWGQFWIQGWRADGVDHLYRPLVSMTYAIQWWIHGDCPWAFHLVNLLLHAAMAAVVAELARRLANQTAGYVAGLLFAVHPIHVEAVAGLVGRAELMGALGMIGAMILFVRRPLTYGRAVGIGFCFILAILSKEQGMLLPAMLLAMHFLWRRKQPVAGGWPGLEAPLVEGEGEMRVMERRPLQLLSLLLCWGLAGYLIFRERILPLEWDRSFLDWSIQPMIRSHGWDLWLMPFVLLGHYVALLLFPLHLSLDYGGAVIGWTVRPGDLYLYIGFLAAAMWVGLLVISIRRRWRAATVCLVCLLLSYSIISNFGILIGTNFGERLMYLPSAFVLILLGLATAKCNWRAIAVVLGGLVIAGSVRSVTYAAQWNDRLHFYHISRLNQPESIMLYRLEAQELAHQGRLKEAAEVLARGRRVLPDYTLIWGQSAEVAIQRGRLEEAKQFLDAAAAKTVNPSYLGWMYEQIKSRRAATRRAAPNRPEVEGQ